MKRWFRRPRGRRGRPSTPLLGLGLLVGLGSLWLMAWNTHRIQVLEAEEVRLSAERAFQQDELRRKQVRWYRLTQRDRIVPRAVAELGLVEPEPGDRQVVALRWDESGREGPAWLRHLARGLDRYGDVDGAFAGEGETP